MEIISGQRTYKSADPFGDGSSPAFVVAIAKFADVPGAVWLTVVEDGVQAEVRLA